MSRPFLWRDGVLTPLRRLGGPYGMALCINAAGDLGGWAETKDAALPVLWRKAKDYAPESVSDAHGSVLALRDDGTAAGTLWVGEARRAVLWSRGDERVLGNPGDVEGTAQALNRAGLVVGFFVPTGGRAQSIWSPGSRQAAQWQEDRRSALPGLDGKLSECTAVNEAGVAVGWADSAEGRRACRWRGGRVEPLPAPAGYSTEAHSINRSGWIVGDASPRTREGSIYACLWRGDQALDLNRQLPPGSGWQLASAAHVSDRGLIVGIGSSQDHPRDRQRAFLLRPLLP